LSQDRILTAAVEVADREGIDAITLRRLAEVLDVHPTSIYNHLASKDAILDGLVEALMAEAALPEVVDDWRDWVRTFAYRMRDVARAHPGAYLVFTRRPAQGPIASRQTEGALDAFRRAGFTVADASNALIGVGLTVLGLALNECPPIGPTVAADVSHLSPDRYPRIFEAFEAAPDDPLDIEASDRMWEYVIESLIVGYERSARKRRAAKRS
jgi:AcrR family transcriptional regulator